MTVVRLARFEGFERRGKLTLRIDLLNLLSFPAARLIAQNQHKAFNQLLNSRVEESAHPSYAFAPVRYSHTRELDTFHEIPAMQGQPKRKVRVTRDQKDKSKPPIAVEKVRVADMNIFSPKRLFDWRVSVSLEMPGAFALPRSFSRRR